MFYLLAQRVASEGSRWTGVVESTPPIQDRIHAPLSHGTRTKI